MIFQSNNSILYSDTLLPDIFITEYMPSMNCNYLKVYIYCLFLSKHSKHASAYELSKKLEMEVQTVKDALDYLENIGIITRAENGIKIVDLKEKEIKKVYRMKSTSTPEEALLSTERNKKRNKIVSAINNSFFQGLMSPSWYTDIDAWFDRYKFEEDVMYALFQHCYDHRGLSRHYITKVAENWYSKKIKNSFDLDKYFIEYEKLRDIKNKICKKLKLSRNLTEYEEEYVENWVLGCNYSFEIIELALKKTTGKTNPSFRYINAIINDWHQNGLKTKQEILLYDKNKKLSNAKKPANDPKVPQQGNFEQRKYDDEYFDNLYDNIPK
ncbi:MAG: DnaD domain protein [Acetivibrionales bacterium]|jgi:DnaD/phage-associated family protein